MFLTVALMLSSASAAPSTPVLPEHWVARIEANIINRNYSYVVHEYFDYPNNRFYSVHHSPDGSSRHSLELPDLDVSASWHGHWGAPESCQVRQLSTSRMENRTTSHGHLQNTATFLHFDLQAKYGGAASIRGIKADAWYHTEPLGFGSNFAGSPMDVEYYTLSPDWQVRDATPEAANYTIPLRARINGTSSFGKEGLHYFDHIYEFVDFRVEAPDDRHFLLPGPQFQDELSASALLAGLWNTSSLCNATAYCAGTAAMVDGKPLVDPKTTAICATDPSLSMEHNGEDNTDLAWHTEGYVAPTPAPPPTAACEEPKKPVGAFILVGLVSVCIGALVMWLVMKLPFFNAKAGTVAYTVHTEESDA